MSEFVHLHLHSQWSLLDGMIRFPSLIDHLQKNGMTACAITDHGWVAGIVSFYKICKERGIKPLLGMEAYLTTDPDNTEEKTKDNYHLVLLAMDHHGYKGLLKLSSEAFLKNFYYKPRIYLPKLEELKGHVIATTACLAGPMTRVAEWDPEKKVFTDPEKKAEDMWKQLCHYFGEECLFLELQDWDDGTGIQPAWNNFLLSFSEEHHSRMVITTDAHYLLEEDHPTHELMMAMQLKMSLERYKEGNVMKYGPWFWVRPPEMMLASAKKIGCEAAYHNTAEIAERCNVEITLGKYHPPVFFPEEADDFPEFLKWQKQQKRKNKQK